MLLHLEMTGIEGSAFLAQGSAQRDGQRASKRGPDRDPDIQSRGPAPTQFDPADP